MYARQVHLSGGPLSEREARVHCPIRLALKGEVMAHCALYLMPTFNVLPKYGCAN